MLGVGEAYTRGLKVSSQIATLLSHLWIISVDHVASSNKIYIIMYDLLWTAMFATSDTIHSWSSQATPPGKKVRGESLHERPNKYLWAVCHKIYHFWHALSCLEYTNQVKKYRLPSSLLSLNTFVISTLTDDLPKDMYARIYIVHHDGTLLQTEHAHFV